MRSQETFKKLIDKFENKIRINSHSSHNIRELSEIYRDHYKNYRDESSLDKRRRLLEMATSTNYYPENSYFIGGLAHIDILNDNHARAKELVNLKLKLNETEPDHALKLHNARISYTFMIRMATKEQDQVSLKKYKDLKAPIDAELGKLPESQSALENYIVNVDKIGKALEQLDGLQAGKLAATMLKKRPNDVFVSNLYAKALLLEGYYVEADKFAEKKLVQLMLSKEDISPEMKERRKESLYMLRGEAKYGMGKFEEAKGWFESVLEINQGNSAAKGLLTSIFIEQGDVNSTKETIAKMKESKNIFALKYEADVLLKQRDYQAAANNYYTFLEQRPNLLVFKKMKRLAEEKRIDFGTYNDFVDKAVEDGLITKNVATKVKASEEVAKELEELKKLTDKPGMDHTRIAAFADKITREKKGDLENKGLSNLMLMVERLRD